MKYLIQATKKNYTRFAVTIPDVPTEVDLAELFGAAKHGREPSELAREIMADRNIIVTPLGENQEVPVVETPKPEKPRKAKVEKEGKE